MDEVSATKELRNSDLQSAGHFGDRRRLALPRLVATLDLMRPYVVPYTPVLSHSCRLPHPHLLGPNGHGVYVFRYTHALSVA